MGTVYEAASRGLHDATNGAISPNPDLVKHFATSMVSGQARIVDAIFGWIKAGSEDRDVDIKQSLPPFAAFISSPTNRIAKDYYRLSEDITSIVGEYKVAVSSQSFDVAERIRQQFPQIEKLTALHNKMRGSVIRASRGLRAITNRTDRDGTTRIAAVREVAEDAKKKQAAYLNAIRPLIKGSGL